MQRLPRISVESYRSFVKTDLPAIFDDAFPAWFPQGAMLDCHNVRLEPPEHAVDSCKLWRRTHTLPLTADVTFAVFDPDGDEDDEPTSTATDRLVVGEIPSIMDDGSFLVNGMPLALVPTLDRSPGLLRERETDDRGNAIYSVKLIPESGPWIALVNSPPDPVVWARINQSKLFPASTLMRALGMDDEDMFRFAESVHGVDRLRIARSRQGTMTALFRRTRRGKWLRTDDGYLAGRVLVHDIGDALAGSVLVPSDVGKLGSQLGPGESIALSVLGISDISLAATCATDDTSTAKQARTALGSAMSASDSGSRDFASRIEQYSLSRTGRRSIQHRTGAKLPDGLVAGTVQTAVRELVSFVGGNGGSFEDDTYSLENRRMVTVGNMLAKSLRDGLRYWQEEVANLVRQTARSAAKPGRKPAGDKPKSLADLTPERVTNRKHITSAMRRLFPKEKAQWLDNINPVASVMDRYRVTVEAGQSSRGSAAKSARWVNSSHFRRISVAETGGGKNVGLANYLTLYSRPDRDGFIRTPAYVVDDGAVTGKVDWLTPHTETRAVIAYADAPIDENGVLTGVPTDVVTDMQPRPEGGWNFTHATEMRVEARVYYRGEYGTRYVDPGEVTHIGVSSDDNLAPAGSLIPFIEHDDSTRIGMASKMMQQAVPCLGSERAMVGTGRERQVAEMCGDSAAVVAAADGVVVHADGRLVVVDGEGPGTGIEYRRLDGMGPGRGSLARYRLRVAPGDRVEKGQVLADGPATVDGSVAIGQNIRVAFVPWRGYNYEDAVVISERMASDDKLTSLHMQQFTCKISKTQLGPEETTGVNIPDTSESDLVHLDDDGLIRIGTVVRERDILVGKVTPKESRELSSIDKLTKLLFDKNYGEVKDSSLRMPPGYDGAVVVDVQVVTPRQQAGEDGVDETPYPTDNERHCLSEYRRMLSERLDTERKLVRSKLTDLADGRRVEKAPGLRRGARIGRRWMANLPMSRWKEIELADGAANGEFHSRLDALSRVYNETAAAYADRRRGPDDRAGGSGVLRRVVVTVAYKRRIQAGDKLAGRHGNKGVVSKVVPVEDMPFDPDTGEPVDLVLNPLGVPSRMNVGQILETHLGLALGTISDKLRKARDAGGRRRDRAEKALHRMASDMFWEGLDTSSPRAMSDDIAKHGVTINSPPFDGIAEDEIKRLLRFAGMPASGQKVLCDGITGEMFDRPCTVGTMYVYKLRHMVEDKVHARSRGRYMMRTNQPVRGRSDHGGQRLGEMEAWALMAYGASANLLEMTTIKSDDARGRSRLEKAIVEREAAVDGTDAGDLPAGVPLADVVPGYTGRPEALGLFLNEVRALGLDVSMELDGERVDQVGPGSRKRAQDRVTVDDVFLSDAELKARGDRR